MSGSPEAPEVRFSPPVKGPALAKAGDWRGALKDRDHFFRATFQRSAHGIFCETARRREAGVFVVLPPVGYLRTVGKNSGLKTPGGFAKDAVRGALEGRSKKMIAVAQCSAQSPLPG